MLDRRSIVANRFVRRGHGWFDLATAGAVALEFCARPPRDELAAWQERCATAARLRHPAMRPLIDFGPSDDVGAFLAYGADPPQGCRPGRPLARHGRRFAASHGVDALVRFRRVVHPQGRPIGVVLQPRLALDAAVEALDAAAPPGVAGFEIWGASGSGLGTLHALLAREARLRGFVPLDVRVLESVSQRSPWLRDRHLLLFVDDRHAALRPSAVAAVLDRTGDASRRHLLFRFSHGALPPGDAIMMERMPPEALRSMVTRDRWSGPSTAEIASAVRAAGGSPGGMLRALGAVAWPRAAAIGDRVHETSPAYRIEPPGPPPSSPRSDGRVARMLHEAPERSRRLVAAGRHAAAGRLLERAARVLRARGQAAAAARAAEELGWLLRVRGRRAEARLCFASLQAGTSQTTAIAATIALAVLDTDELRLHDAEAALRTSLTASALLHEPGLAEAGRVALARCLLHQDRCAEGLAVLGDALKTAAAHAVRARLATAAGDVRGALTHASNASAALGDAPAAYLRCQVWRALALARRGAGDDSGARDAAHRALEAATTAHLPLQALKGLAVARLVGLQRLEPLRFPDARDVPGGTGRAGDLPPLLARTFASERQPSAPASSGAQPPLLRVYLDLVQSAADDGAAVRGLCERLARDIEAADVAVVEGEDGRVVARTGRDLGGGLGARAIATAATVVGRTAPVELAAPIVYGGTVLGAVQCRFTVGRDLHVPAVVTALEAAAVALEAPLRAIADRRQAPAPPEAWPDLLGTSSSIAALRQAISAAARAPFPVLIEGESGSGKELVARAIHRLSLRASRRLCTLNCAALTDDLIEAELFGHTRGAFTGALAERAGLFEDADGGTLFLDEVGELSPRAQAKLLRVLQDGEIRRVGESFPRRVSARVIAASNRDLRAEVAAGRFRSDLRFRLDVLRIRVPPLRQRAVDIPLLARHFWDDAAGRVGSRATLSPDALAALSRHDWPGNVRELQNVVAALAVHGPRRGRITPGMLPQALGNTASSASPRFEDARVEFERRFVRAALANAAGHKARAARDLGVSRQGLAKMLRRLGLEHDGEPEVEDSAR